jgi:protein dithiol oxidoreductase (disulfide-forming)
MQRRDFSRSMITAGALASASAAMSPVWAQRIGFKEGTDYLRLPAPVPVAAPAGQIEVVEFFAYSCIHCFRFEPLLEAWIGKLPEDVKVRRNPIAFSPAFQPMQRLYFTLESMGLVDKLHAKVFHAFHEENQKLVTPEAITAWVEKQGVNREQFLAFFNGSAVKMAQAATQLQEAYKVEGTPALGVAGRFYVGGQGPKTLVIADSLVAQVRKG